MFQIISEFVLDTFQFGLFICAVLIWIVGILDAKKFKKKVESKPKKPFITYKFIETKNGMVCCEEIWDERSEPIIRIINE